MAFIIYSSMIIYDISMGMGGGYSGDGRKIVIVNQIKIEICREMYIERLIMFMKILTCEKVQI